MFDNPVGYLTVLAVSRLTAAKRAFFSGNCSETVVYEKLYSFGVIIFGSSVNIVETAKKVVRWGYGNTRNDLEIIHRHHRCTSPVGNNPR
ncbi:MAG: hypothetical protein LBD09_05485, partial [Treponema sp.]|nr:hypothetical protein [Treponema sp.]